MILPVVLLSLLVTTTLAGSPTTTASPPTEIEDRLQASSSISETSTPQNKAKRQLYHLTIDHPDPYQDETTFYASKQLQQQVAAPHHQQQQQQAAAVRLEQDLRSRQQAPVYQLRTNYLNIVPPHAGIQKPQVYTQQSSQLPSIVVPVTQQPLRQLPKFHYQLPAATYKPLTYYNLQQYHAPTYQKMDGPPKPLALESQNSCGEKSNTPQHLQPQQQVVEEQYEQSPPNEYPAGMLLKSEALVQQAPHLAPIHVYQTPNGQYKIAPQLYGGPQLFKQPQQQLVPALRFHYVEHAKKPKPVQVVLRKKVNDEEDEEVVPEKKVTKKKYEEPEDADEGKKHQSSDDEDEDDSKGSYEKSDRGRSGDDSFKPSKHYPYDEDRKYGRKHHGSKGGSGEFKHYNDDDVDVVKSKPGKSSEKSGRDYRRPNSSNHRGGNNDGDETQNVEVYKENPVVPILQKMLPTEIKQKKVYRENWYITKSIQN